MGSTKIRYRSYAVSMGYFPKTTGLFVNLLKICKFHNKKINAFHRLRILNPQHFSQKTNHFMSILEKCWEGERGVVGFERSILKLFIRRWKRIIGSNLRRTLARFIVVDSQYTYICIYIYIKSLSCKKNGMYKKLAS